MTRKEAIEIVRKNYPHISFSGSQFESALRELIPELHESENERIRKSLIDYFKHYNPKDKWDEEFSFKDVLSYLEKQKEPNGEDEERTNFTIYHPLKNGKGKYECIPYSFYGSLTSFSEDKDLIDFLRTCFYTEEECNKWIEQQKEQKPAEWHPEDEQNLNVCLSYIKDESLRSWLIDAIHVRYDKPAEWSNEDDTTIKSATHWLEKYLSTIRAIDVSPAGKNGILTVKTTINNLKSLRPQPHWKPSEELLSALHTAAYLREMVFYGGLKDKLRELDTQFRKRM